MKNDKIILELVRSFDVLNPCNLCFFQRSGICGFVSEKFGCTDENGVEYIWKLKKKMKKSRNK